ncbi:MAG: N-acetyltransferase [Mariprofundus sp.]|nr:N-acetyltransferase [Mariprofundus sp.]
MPYPIHIRSAIVDDVEAIYQLLLPYAEQDIILLRDRDNIFQHLQEFLVAVIEERVVGVVCAHIYAENLAEVRSLAVDPACQKHGVGRLLVDACEQWLSGLGVSKVFALTYVTGFFIKQGYSIVSKESLPHKIWTVCVHCSRFSHCDEVAVEKSL